MKGLLKDALLIGVTALAVTVYQGHAQDDENENLRYDLTCPTGQIVVKFPDRLSSGGGTLLPLGFTGYYAETGQVTTLTNCQIVYYAVEK